MENISITSELRCKKNVKKANMENISITSELRKLDVDGSVVFPPSVEWSTIRSIAGRFNSAGKSAFSVKKVEGGYEVTRTR